MTAGGAERPADADANNASTAHVLARGNSRQCRRSLAEYRILLKKEIFSLAWVGGTSAATASVGGDSDACAPRMLLRDARRKFTVRVNWDILFEVPYEPLQADPQPLSPGDRGLRRRTAAAVWGR